MTDQPQGAPAPEPVAPVPSVPASPPAPISLHDATEQWRAAPAQPRNPDGTFAGSTPAEQTVAPTASADPAPTNPDTTAPADDPTLYIEAKLGEEVVRLRKDTLIPQLRHGEVTWKPLSQIQSEGMLKADYDAKMQDRRRMEQDLAYRRAELEARAQQFEAEEARLRQATADPAAWDRYQAHLQRVQDDPDYRQLVEDRHELGALKARAAAEQTVREQAVVQEAVQTATQWITDAVARHPGVSEERVRARYGQALAAGTARFDPADVAALVAEEAQHFATAVQPLTDKVAALEAALARFTAEREAQTRNDTTQHALRRAQTVPTSPAGGSPPAPGRRPAVPEGTPRDLHSMTEAWRRT